MSIQRKNISTQKKSIDFGIVIFLLFLIFFVGRCISIMGRNTERGGLAYVQILNFTLPVVENQVYNEGAYLENHYSIKNICLEALGLSNLTEEGILISEMPMLAHDLKLDPEKEVEFAEYELGEESVLKYDKTEKKDDVRTDELKKEFSKNKKEILIYHTHTAENYAESKGPTDNKKNNVVGVGEVLEKELEETYGISVIHDKTKHDVSYNDSYDRSRETVKKYHEKYGDKFDLVIDLHRDGGSKKSSFVQKVNGKNAAKVMFVTTRNSKNFANNNKIADSLQSITEELYPGLTRKRMIYNHGDNCFNQDIFKNGILFEIGANVNTSGEAQYTAKLMARVIAEYLSGK